jgi:hypothetical protein
MSTMRDQHVSHVQTARSMAVRGNANRLDNIDELEAAALALPEHTETLQWVAERLRLANTLMTEIADKLGEVVEFEHMARRTDAVVAAREAAEMGVQA